VLSQPYAWEGLGERESGEIRIELSELIGLTSTLQLEPEPVPLTSLVLIGERLTHYLLAELDPEFPELFNPTSIARSNAVPTTRATTPG
jgi:hypothetical protein